MRSCSFYSFLSLLLVAIAALYASFPPSFMPSMPTSTNITSPGPAHLLIVMGTSGSGKSTLGSHLASALSLPFIDGDDLHPKANVEKMSRGEPLGDEDREGWLKRLRERAWEIVLEQDQARPTAAKGQGQGREEGISTEQRLLAEVFETSAGQGVDTRREVEEIKAQALTEERAAASEEAAPASNTSAPTSSVHSSSSSSQRAVVIACSALKRSYRSLLRGEIDSLPTSLDPTPTRSTRKPSPEEMRTLHIYVEVSPEELLRRMHDRKGHFMKESMLRSQLDTLQKPVEGEEEGVLVLQDGQPQEVLSTAVRRVKELMN